MKQKATIFIMSFCTMVFLFLCTGCLDNPTSNEDSVTIELTGIDTMEVTKTLPIAGKITTNPAITGTGIAISITNSAGADVTASFGKSETQLAVAKNKIDLTADLKLSFTPIATVVSGMYKLVVTVTAGAATSTKSDDFYVKGATVNTLTEKNVELGSFQNPTLGSSLDADSMNVYLVAAAAAISDQIDIWYSNEARSKLGPNVLYSPKQAGLAQHAPKTWTTQNETMMAVVAPTLYDVTTTQVALDAVWATVAETDKKQLIRANANDVIVFKTVGTNGGNVRMLKFISGDGTNAGKAVLKGKY